MPKINKRSIPNKSVAMGKFLKINKRSATFIWHTRLAKYLLMYNENKLSCRYDKVCIIERDI